MLTAADMFTGPARPMDPRVTLDQIGPMVLAACGAREIVHDADGGMVWFTVGRKTARSIHKVIIRLNAADLYDVVRFRYDRREIDNVIEDRRDDVPAESLASVVRDLGDR